MLPLWPKFSSCASILTSDHKLSVATQDCNLRLHLFLQALPPHFTSGQSYFLLVLSHYVFSQELWMWSTILFFHFLAYPFWCRNLSWKPFWLHNCACLCFSLFNLLSGVQLWNSELPLHQWHACLLALAAVLLTQTKIPEDLLCSCADRFLYTCPLLFILSTSFSFTQIFSQFLLLLFTDHCVEFLHRSHAIIAILCGLATAWLLSTSFSIWANQRWGTPGSAVHLWERRG